MNRPSLSVRLAGSPAGATLLLIASAIAALGWCQGHVPGVLAIVAVAGAWRTLKAVVLMRRYKTWLADWQAMGADDDEPQPRVTKTRGRGWVLVTGAALLVLSIPPCLTPVGTPARPSDRWLAVLWLAACLYLVFALVRAVVRRVMRGRKGKAEKAEQGEAAPVAWLVARASSSPSRAEAERELPQYAARLIAQSKGALPPC
jgi:hypothetical protein